MITKVAVLFAALLFFLQCNGVNGSSVDADEPPLWVDIIFVVWILTVHVYYAFQFTNYTLKHIYRELDSYADNSAIDPNSSDNSNNDDNNNKNKNVSNKSVIRSQSLSVGVLKYGANVPKLENKQSSVNIEYEDSKDGGNVSDADSNNSNNKGKIDKNNYEKPRASGSARINDNDKDNNNNNNNNNNNEAGASGATVDGTVGDSGATELAKDTFNELKNLADDDIIQEAFKMDQRSNNNNNNDNENDNDNDNDNYNNGMTMANRKKKLENTLYKAKKMVDSHLNVEYTTLARPLKGLPNRCCCYDKLSNKLFNWDRTYSIRIFLKIFVTLSQCLSFVLAIEIFFSAVLEYIITIYLRLNDFWFGLVCIWPMIFVCEQGIRSTFHALTIAWEMAGDKNGDIESLDSTKLRDISKSLREKARNLLKAQKRIYRTLHAQSVSLYEIELQNLAPNTVITPHMLSIKTISAGNESTDDATDHSDTPSLEEDYDPTTAQGTNTANTIVAAVATAVTTAVATAVATTTTSTKTQEDKNENPNDTSNKNKKNRKNKKNETENENETLKNNESNTNDDDNNNNNSNPFVTQFEWDPKIVDDIRGKVFAAIEKHEDVIIGDFFIGTCWRLHVATCIFVCTGIGGQITEYSYLLQFMMRYMAISGIIWTAVYFVFAAGVSYYSRWHTWTQIHIEMPKKYFFLFVDAFDYDIWMEKGKGGCCHREDQNYWFQFKVFIASFCILSVFGCGVAAAVYGGEHDDNWGLFVFSIFILFNYYWFNTLVVCKPYALLSLWRDTIPQPSIEYIKQRDKIIRSIYLHERDADDDDDDDMYDGNNKNNSNNNTNDNNNNNDDDDDDDKKKKDNKNNDNNGNNNISNKQDKRKNSGSPRKSQHVFLQQQVAFWGNRAGGNQATKAQTIILENEFERQFSNRHRSRSEQNSDMNADLVIDTLFDGTVFDELGDTEIENGVNHGASTSIRSRKQGKGGKGGKGGNRGKSGKHGTKSGKNREKQKEKEMVSSGVISPDSDAHNNNSNAGVANASSSIIKLKSSDNVENQLASALKLANVTSRYDVDSESKKAKSHYKHFTYRMPEQTFVNQFDSYKRSKLMDENNNDIYGKYDRELYWHKFNNLLNNYSLYWMDMYRPYDEYNIEQTLYRSQFLVGCHCWERCLRTTPEKENRKAQKRAKKERKQQQLQEQQRQNSINSNDGGGHDNDIFNNIFNYDKKEAYQCRKDCHKFVCKSIGWMLDRICNICLLIIFILVLLFLYYVTATDEIDTATSSSNSDNSYDSSNENSTYIQQYGICDAQWQDRDGNAVMSVIDVSVLTEIAYEMDDHDLLQTIEAYFDDKYEVIARRDVEPLFFHMRHKTEYVDYIVVRGTDSFDDVLQDLTLYIEITLFQALSWIFPILTAMPPSFVRSLIYYSSIAEGIINSEVREQFGDIVYDYTYDYLSSLNHSTNIYVAGHSLGGCVAQVVAARLYESADDFEYTPYISSYGLNSPGTYYSSAKFEFEMDSLELTSISVLTKNDIVSMVDSHAGNIQKVLCHQDFYTQCHSLDVPLCELLDNCASNNVLQYSVVKSYCNEEADKISILVGAQAIEDSNFTVTYAEPVQYINN